MIEIFKELSIVVSDPDIDANIQSVLESFRELKSCSSTATNRPSTVVAKPTHTEARKAGGSLLAAFRKSSKGTTLDKAPMPAQFGHRRTQSAGDSDIFAIHPKGQRQNRSRKMSISSTIAPLTRKLLRKLYPTMVESPASKLNQTPPRIELCPMHKEPSPLCLLPDSELTSTSLKVPMIDANSNVLGIWHETEIKVDPLLVDDVDNQIRSISPLRRKASTRTGINELIAQLKEEFVRETFLLIKWPLFLITFLILTSVDIDARTGHGHIGGSAAH